MCATFEYNGKSSRPSKTILARSKKGFVENVWAGFARVEILDWWRKQGAEELDIFATRFAERSKTTGKLIWDDVPSGLVIRALLVPEQNHQLIKIVTRASNPEELLQFDHPRMPLLEGPLFGPIPANLPVIGNSQAELF